LTRAIYLENKCIYLCGNSLGLLSKTSYALVQQELGAWGTR
jgi:kynureninase